MERITYRITLDAHRNGIQRQLQGFETSDKMSRRVSVNLVAGGDTFELPMLNVVAMMYITTPSAKEPSINKCLIDGNTIIYNIEPIVEEGITEMQLKVIESSPEGAKKVLASPRFSVEVTKSNTDDESATQTTTFTALEEAIAKADGVYNSRILRVVIEEDCTFKVYYADGTVYENDYFRDAMYNGNALLSQSYAVGGAGVREGEDQDNSKYYSNVSRSASEDAKKVYDESHELMMETQKQANYTYFQLNFETGNLGYVSTNTAFNINQETGNLETSRDETYTPEDVIRENVELFINEKSQEIDANLDSLGETIENNHTQSETKFADVNQRMDKIGAIANGSVQALAFDTYQDMIKTVNETVTDWKVGQSIYIKNKDCPDLWVSDISDNFETSTYTDDETFKDLLHEHFSIHVGYYILSFMETDLSVLGGYVSRNELESAKRELIGDNDTVGVTILGAYDLANEMLPINNIAVIEGTVDVSSTRQAIISYPEGFTKQNSLITTPMCSGFGTNNFITSSPTDALGTVMRVSMRDSDILLSFNEGTFANNTASYRFALIRIEPFIVG